MTNEFSPNNRIMMRWQANNETWTLILILQIKINVLLFLFSILWN